jgi:hypothetical protein
VIRERTLENQRVRHPEVQNLSKPAAPGSRIVATIGSVANDGHMSFSVQLGLGIRFTVNG